MDLNRFVKEETLHSATAFHNISGGRSADENNEEWLTEPREYSPERTDDDIKTEFGFFLMILWNFDASC